MRQLGADFGPLRSEHRRVLRDAFGRHGGHEIDTAGDGFFVVFERAGDAVAAAVAAQQALHGADPGNTPLRVRMGLHSAEPYLDEEGYVGVGVHRAARICAAGHGGQILLSNATAGIVEDLGLEGVQLQELGEHGLKDIERPQRLFQLLVQGLPSTFPPLRSPDAAQAQPAIVTLLITDLVGWWNLLQRLGDERTAVVAGSYHRIAIDAVKDEGGREVEVAGDTVMALFERPSDALRAATKLRSALRTEPWVPDGEPLAVRIAIHSGRVADPTSRHFGTVAYRCGSLCATAEPGQILVSHATEALLEGEPRDVTLRGLGERTLEKLEHPVQVFEVQG